MLLSFYGSIPRIGPLESLVDYQVAKMSHTKTGGKTANNVLDPVRQANLVNFSYVYSN